MCTLIYGVVVKEEEFFTEERVEGRCRCRTTAPRGPGPYCPYCGVRYRSEPEYVPTELCRRFAERFKVTPSPKGWHDSSYGVYIQSSRWFHQRTNRYGNRDEYGLIGQELPTEAAMNVPWSHDGSLYFFRPEAFSQRIVGPDDPDYVYIDDSMARFLEGTRAELERLGLLEGRTLGVYLW